MKKQPARMCWVVGGPMRGSLIIHQKVPGVLDVDGRIVRLGNSQTILSLPEEVEPFLPTCAPDLNALAEDGLLKECRKLHPDDFVVLAKANPDFTAVVHFCVSKGEWIVHTAHGSMLYRQLLIKEFELHVFPQLPFQPKGFMVTRYGNIKLDGEVKKNRGELYFDKALNQFLLFTPDGLAVPYAGGANLCFTAEGKAILT